MFYKTDQPHGLKHNPFNALVIPRPIGWISTVDTDGNVNLAPYSFFNGVAYTPPQVMFSSTGPHDAGGLKDTVANIEATGEFVVNLVTVALAEPMNATSAPAPHDTDEFTLAGVTAEASELIAPPRVKESPVHFECRHVQTVDVLSARADHRNMVVFGEVIGVHIDDSIIVDGMVRYDLMKPIGRLGYMDYTAVGDVFSMDRPGWP